MRSGHVLRLAAAVLFAAGLTCSGTAGAQTSGCGGASFARDMLTAHNQLRARHGAPPLSLAPDINSVAQQWADHMAATGEFSHRPRKNYSHQPNSDDYGENLAIKMTPGRTVQVSGAEVTQQWYQEINDYYPYFGVEPDMSKFDRFGHFTQVAWKASTRLGVGIACRGSTTAYIVANYHPAGNIEGTYARNVGRPK